MLLWSFWVLAALLHPALLQPGQTAPAPIVVGLALVALLVVAAVSVPRLTPAAAPGVRAFARRARVSAPSRLIDPDAAGRPRPRAPSVCPATR